MTEPSAPDEPDREAQTGGTADLSRSDGGAAAGDTAEPPEPHQAATAEPDQAATAEPPEHDQAAAVTEPVSREPGQGMTAVEPAPPAPRKKARGLRWTGAVVLIVIAALLMMASVVARYARAELLNTDRYVATVTPLAKNPDIQHAVTTRVSDAIMAKADIPGLTEQLVGGLDVPGAQTVAGLAAPALTNWVDQQVTRIVGNVVSSPQFATVWEQANRSAHTQITKLLTGENGKYTSTQEGDVVIDLGAIVGAVRDALVAKGWTFLSRIPDVSIPYTVAHIDNLPKVQRAVDLLQKLAWVLPVLALVLLALAVWCAPDHRRGAVVALLATAGGMLLFLIAYAALRQVYANRAEAKGLNVDVALDVWNTVLRPMIQLAWAVVIVSLLGAVIAYLFGPGRGARWVRGLIT
ncbi:RAD23 family protein [Hamadaea tsunoensis]|uniref:hypothetical protein n=1 Tax=Hamadaea tsunoensis TaxID=53368 RepID=UPI00040FCB18|nr:hypothetical protein [Hamadaea tsunoensis]